MMSDHLCERARQLTKDLDLAGSNSKAWREWATPKIEAALRDVQRETIQQVRALYARIEREGVILRQEHHRAEAAEARLTALEAAENAQLKIERDAIVEQANSRGEAYQIADSLYQEAEVELTSIKARLREQHAQIAWQPIATAPKDGTEVLLYGVFAKRSAARPFRAIGLWFEVNQTFAWWVVAALPFTPTHWMPLPDPPAMIPPETP
jgi:hypothetical protein